MPMPLPSFAHVGRIPGWHEMATYLLSYDLDKPGDQNYTRLESRLLELGAKRVLFSQWVLLSGQDTITLEKDFLTYINPSTDSLLVVQITAAQTSWNKLRISDAEFNSILRGPSARYKPA